MLMSSRATVLPCLERWYTVTGTRKLGCDTAGRPSRRRLATRFRDERRDAVGVVLPQAPAESRAAATEPAAAAGSTRRAPVLPLEAVVNYELCKMALLLGAVDPGLGGVLIGGGRGTGKTVMARALHALLPPIEVVAGSYCNADPDSPGEWEEGLQNKLLQTDGTRAPEAVSRRMVAAPFVSVPLGVTEDRLLGAVDVQESVKQGSAVLQPGLLASAHRGVLQVDDVQLLEPATTMLLLNALSAGRNTIEREGLSTSHPCRALLVATCNPEDGPVPPALKDSCAVQVELGPLPQELRLRAVDAVLAWQDHRTDLLAEIADDEAETRARIAVARELHGTVRITRDQVKYLVKEAMHCGAAGHRGEIAAVRAARAAAALAGRDHVTAPDLRLAVQLCILPRATILEVPAQKQPPPPAPPQQQEGQEQQDEEEQAAEEQQQEQEQQQEEQADAAAVPLTFVFSPEGVVLDPAVLALAQPLLQRARGKAGGSKKAVVYSQDRGRYVQPMFPKGPVKRLAVDATLRAAAPHQLHRRQRHQQQGDKVRKVYIEQDDIRAKRLARKAGSLVLLVTDASGSMALNRMAAAKGAALQLLADSYTSRAQVALVCFCGMAAEVLLPPTRAIAMARRRLEALPCGGGTPLAHALMVAGRVAIAARKRGSVGRCLLVVITDGRANVSLGESLEALGEPSALAGQVVAGITGGQAGQEGDSDGQPGAVSRDRMKEEVLALAKRLGVAGAGLNMLVVDTESQYLSRGIAKEIAAAAGGVYWQLPGGVKGGKAAGRDLGKRIGVLAKGVAA